MKSGILIAAMLLASASRAGADGARLRFDFEAATLDVITDQGAHHFELAQELGPRLADFRTGLAKGEWSSDTARALGRDLLGPAADALRDADRWEVTPLEAAPLAALIAPGDTHALVYEVALWYRPAGGPRHDLAPLGPAGEPEPGRGVLAVAPFSASADPTRDSPDTLLAGFRATSRSLDLVPRNDTTPETVAGALKDHAYALVWLRCDPERTGELLAPLSGGPHLLWWTWPAPQAIEEEASAESAFEPATWWTAGGKSMMLDLWPRREEPASRGARIWAEAMGRGEDLATALALARRDLAATANVEDWAGWILVGDGQRTLTWQKPRWWQRWLRR